MLNAETEQKFVQSSKKENNFNWIQILDSNLAAFENIIQLPIRGWEISICKSTRQVIIPYHVHNCCLYLTILIVFRGKYVNF